MENMQYSEFQSMTMAELNNIHRCLVRSSSTRNSKNISDVEKEIKKRVKRSQV